MCGYNDMTFRKFQRLADWQHPIFFGPAPMDGLDVQMDVRLLANQIRRSFSQRSQPEELIEARHEMRDEMRDPESPKGPPLRAALLSNFNESLSLRIFQEERLMNISQSTQGMGMQLTYSIEFIALFLWCLG